MSAEHAGTNEARRKLVERWRAQKLTWSQIGEKLGISAQAAWRVLHPPQVAPPLAAPRTYLCAKCGTRFKSLAKRGPARCRNCGTHLWREQ